MKTFYAIATFLFFSGTLIEAVGVTDVGSWVIQCIPVSSDNKNISITIGDTGRFSGDLCRVKNNNDWQLYNRNFEVFGQGKIYSPKKFNRLLKSLSDKSVNSKRKPAKFKAEEKQLLVIVQEVGTVFMRDPFSNFLQLYGQLARNKAENLLGKELLNEFMLNSRKTEDIRKNGHCFSTIQLGNNLISFNPMTDYDIKNKKLHDILLKDHSEMQGDIKYMQSPELYALMFERAEYLYNLIVSVKNPATRF